MKLLLDIIRKICGENSLAFKNAEKGVFSYDFSKVVMFSRINKKRLVAYIKNKTSLEYALSVFINEICKKNLQNKTPNVKKIIGSICKDLDKIKDSNEFTILKFDFKSFYKNISNEYVYKSRLEKNIKNEYKKFFENYINQIPYAIPGLVPSNSIAETLMGEFHQKLKDELNQFGLIGMYHYVDDFIIILDKTVLKSILLEKISYCANKVFFNFECRFPNKIKIYTSGEKFSYFTNDDILPCSFTYLGYKFSIFKNNTIAYKIGLSNFTIDRYKNKIEKIINQNYNNAEKLRLLLFLNTRRIVHKTNNSLKQEKFVCTSIIQSFFPLKQKDQKLFVEKLDNDTAYFFKNIIVDCFKGKCLPYYIRDENLDNGYCLWHNILNNKTIYLSEKKGWKYEKLLEFCKKIDIDCDYGKMTYDNLVEHILNLYNTQ